MRPADAGHRRAFLRTTGITVGIAATGCLPIVASARPVPADDPDAVLKRLLEGNARFVAGQTSLLSRRRPEDFAALAEGQAPSAIILSCADSRVPPELVFDQGVGDLFVVRVAGNIVTGAGPVVKASLEFAVAELGARLILVMGHTACGAVKAAIEHIDKSDALPGTIGQLVDIIRPAVVDAKGQPGDRLENTIRANVRKCVATIKGLDPILSATSGLKVVGGVYDLKSGRVEILA